MAIDVTPLAGPATGVAHFVSGLLGALAARDDVRITPYLLSWRARRARGARRDHDRDAGALVALPRPPVHLPLPAGLALRAWSRSDRPTVDRWLDRADDRPRVLHATNFLAPPLRRGGTVVTVHDCAFVRSPELASPAARRFAPALERAIARGAWVHTPSRHVAREVAERFSTDRVVAVPSGVPPLPEGDGASGHAGIPGFPARQDGGPDGSPYVLALGTLEPRKNLPRLIAAFASLTAGHPDVRLVVAGPDGPGRPAVETALAALPPALRRRVVLLGPVDEATRTRLLRAAAVLAYPSLDEGFGFPVLEAMTLGTPVVAAAAGAIPEVAGDAALLVDPSDTAALADGLAAALSDDGLRRRLSAAGRRRVTGFSWTATAAGLVDLYRRAAR